MSLIDKLEKAVNEKNRTGYDDAISAITASAENFKSVDFPKLLVTLEKAGIDNVSAVEGLINIASKKLNHVELLDAILKVGSKNGLLEQVDIKAINKVIKAQNDGKTLTFFSEFKRHFEIGETIYFGISDKKLPMMRTPGK